MRVCDGCGSNLEDEVLYCEKCGKYNKLDPKLSQSKDLVNTKNSESIGLIIILACISVVLAGLGLKGLGTNKEQTENNKKYASSKGEDSIFVGDISCGFEGATYILERDDFQLYMSEYPTYEGGELSVPEYTYSFSLSEDLYYGEAYTTISDRYYDKQGDIVQDGAELTFFENGDVKVDWCIFYWHGEDYTYTTLIEEVFDRELVTCTSDYVRYEDSLDKLESFEIQDMPSPNIFRDIDNGKLKAVEFYGYDEEEGLCFVLTRDFIDEDTYIQFELNDLYMSIYTDEEISYDEEKEYLIDSYSGDELPYKYKRDGTKQYDVGDNAEYYELRFAVSEENIKVECIFHEAEEEFSYSAVIDEEYVQRRTIIEN